MTKGVLSVSALLAAALALAGCAGSTGGSAGGTTGGVAGMHHACRRLTSRRTRSSRCWRICARSQAADAGTSGNMTKAKQLAAAALTQARIAARLSG